MVTEDSLIRWTEVLNAAVSGQWSQSLDDMAEFIDSLVQLFEVTGSRFFTVYNITAEDVAVSMVPADLTLQSLCRGPWLKLFQARRFQAMSPCEMLAAFQDTPAKHPYVLQFRDPENLPDALRQQSRDEDQVRMALARLRAHDPPAASHLIQVFERAFDEDGTFYRDDRWDSFYDQVAFMRDRHPTHRSPPPKISRLPLPTFIQRGQILNEVLTTTPSFTQAMMFSPESLSVIQQQFALPLLCARVAHMQRTLQQTGQLTLTLNPSLRMMAGLHPRFHGSHVAVDWKKWLSTDIQRSNAMNVYSTYTSLAYMLPWEDHSNLDLIHLAAERDHQGVWQPKPSPLIAMVQMVVSPPATPCVFQPRWVQASERSFSLNMVSIKQKPIRSDDWEFQVHFSFEQYELYEAIVAHLKARLVAAGFEHVTWKTFFPIVPSLAVPVTRPLVLWPMADLRIDSVASLLEKSDRLVFRQRPHQTGNLMDMIKINKIYQWDKLA